MSLPWTDDFGFLVINSALELGSDRVAAHGVSRGLQAVTDHLDGVLMRERMTQRHRLVSHFLGNWDWQVDNSVDVNARVRLHGGAL